MANRLANPLPQFLDGNGDPYSSGSLEFYQSGTSTPLDTFSDQALATANPNPLSLDSAGRPANPIFLKAQNYKVVLKDGSGGIVWTEDPVTSLATAGSVVWTSSLNNAVGVSLGAELDRRRVVTPAQFGTYTPDDSGVDNAPSINAAISALKAAGGGTVQLGAGDIYIASTIENFDNPAVHIDGISGGWRDNNERPVTKLLAMSGFTGTAMIDVKPQSTSSDYNIFGPKVTNLFLDGQGNVDVGLRTFNIRGGLFENITVKDTNADGILQDCMEVASEGDFNTQHCSVKNISIEQRAGGATSTSNGIRWDSPFDNADSPTGNISLNHYANIEVYVEDGVAFDVGNSDHNYVELFRCFVPSTTAGDGIVFRGGATSGMAARDNWFVAAQPAVNGSGDTIRAETGTGQDAEYNTVDLWAGNGIEGGTFVDNNATTSGFALRWSRSQRFRATMNTSQTISAGPTKVNFNSADVNRGNGFRTANQWFSAQVPAPHYFEAVLMHTNGVTAGDVWSIKLVHENGSGTTLEALITSYKIPSTQFNSVTINGVFDMSAGDRVYVEIERSSGSGDFIITHQANSTTPRSWFHGYPLQW